MKKPIYIFQDGDLQRKDNNLYFKNETGKKYIPIEQTSALHIFGEVNATKKFLEYCSQNEIIIHFYNHYGYYSGTFYPREHYNSGFMIIKQAEFYIDEKKRLQLAKLFVKGAKENILQVLKYYNNRGKKIENTITKINEISFSIDDADSINSLMGIEGNIREVYYSAFDKILENQDFKFEKRSKRPPKNRINSLISFGNSILYTIVLGEIYKTHLDPRISYLHSANFRRFSLNLDISEIFKPIIIDRIILKMIAKKIITKKSFEKEINSILLKEKARKTFLKEIEDKLTTTIKHKTLGRKVSYRRLIKMEIYKLEKHLMMEEEYHPFVSNW